MGIDAADVACFVTGKPFDKTTHLGCGFECEAVLTPEDTLGLFFDLLIYHKKVMVLVGLRGRAECASVGVTGTKYIHVNDVVFELRGQKMLVDHIPDLWGQVAEVESLFHDRYDEEGPESLVVFWESVYLVFCRFKIFRHHMKWMLGRYLDSTLVTLRIEVPLPNC